MKKTILLSAAFLALLTWQLSAQITLDLKVFLEGPFIGSSMNTNLNSQNLIPLTQPFIVAPWNYTGTEQVSSIPNPDIVDWVLVELRETSGDVASATSDKMINRQAAFINADGSIVGIDGSSMIVYNGTITSNLYVLIWHRNHIAIMSSSPLTEEEELYSWDFTDALNKAYLNGQNSLGNNFFGMPAGDSDGNGTIDNLDYNPEWATTAGTQGYYPSDLNLDGQVNNPDKNEIWVPNLGISKRLPWECGMTILDERDNQSYNTILIGTQCWMAENLNIGIMIDDIFTQTNNTTIEKYCYGSNTEYCSVYGGLYQWDEMMQYNLAPGSQGICPSGWHLPEEMEWTSLVDYLGGENIAGGKLKATGTFEEGTGLWYSPNLGATNSSGFSAISAGFHPFSNLGITTHFWSSTQISTINAWGVFLTYDSEGAYQTNYLKDSGYSVRCLKDSPATWSCGDPLHDNRDGQTYNTVQIGEQCWMAENLNTGIMIDGSINQTNNSSLEKYCYDNNIANCEVYGGLYQWDEMMQYTTNPGVQGICPVGWHLPDNEDWTLMIDFLGGYEIAGGKMKSTGTIEAGTGLWLAPNTGATNVSGFTALPGGLNYYPEIIPPGDFGLFQTSTDYGGSIALRSTDTYAHPEGWPHNTGSSVRCISDITPPWTCGLEFNDSRDGQTYNTVEIGTQCWMAENLNIGTLIPVANNMENDSIIEKYCYDNVETNCDIYGGLYQWNEMMQYSTLESSQGICPDGWHLPDFDEWHILSLFLGEGAGGKMKTTGTIEEGNGLWHSPNFGATNESGFSGLPSGYSANDIFWNLSHMTNFWTSTVQIEPKAYFRRLYRMDSMLGLGFLNKECGFSVRCLKD